MKRLTVGIIYALHYVLYLCTLNKSRLAGAASLATYKKLFFIMYYVLCFISRSGF
jgi:hypothetical protein